MWHLHEDCNARLVGSRNDSNVIGGGHRGVREHRGTPLRRHGAKHIAHG
eukprot:SAG11_NODE_27993_length_326_cov_1.295154_2_plen_48_part_01